MTKKFEPSDKSFVQRDRLLANLDYWKKASDFLNEHLLLEQDIPAWVADRIDRATAEMNVAVGYTKHVVEKKAKKS